MPALAKLLLISSLFVLVFAQITTWPAMRTNAVLTRVLAAEYPSPGDSQRPQGITRMGNNYFTIWKGDSRIFKRPVISPSGASQIPEITLNISTPGLSLRSIWSSPVDEQMYLFVDGSGSTTSIYTVNNVTGALTLYAANINFGSTNEYAPGGIVSGGTNYVIQFNSNVFYYRAFSGPSVSYFGCTPAGNEIASPVARTRFAWYSSMDTSFLMWDSTDRVIRAYDSTVCTTTYCSATGTNRPRPIREWLLADDGATGVIGPEGLLGATEDGLVWLYDSTNQLLKGYGLDCSTAGSTAPTATFPASISVNGSVIPNNYCYPTATDSPDVFGWPTNLHDDCTPTSALSVTYTDTLIPPPVCSLNDYRRKVSRVWKITDSSGNSATSTQIISTYGKENTANIDNAVRYLIPIWAPATQECGAPFIKPSVFDCRQVTDNPSWITASDSFVSNFICSPGTRRTQVNRSYGGNGCDGTQEFTVYDNTQTIDLIDSTPPTITTVPRTVNSCTLDSSPVGVTYADSCPYSSTYVTVIGDRILTMNPPTSCGSPYTRVYERTWAAVDSCGNVAYATQIINVVDTTPPTFTISNSNCTCSDVSSPNTKCLCGQPTAIADDCGIATSPTVSYTTNGCTSRTWSITDSCGNTASKVQSFV